MATWYTVGEARDEWPDAPTDYGDGGDSTLTQLLAVAKEAVIAYAYQHELADIEAGDIRDGLRSAQLMQARNVWTSAKVSTDGGFDGGQYGISAGFPLDWQVRQEIRPKFGKPWIG